MITKSCPHFKGANSNMLTIYNIQPQDSGDYRCVIKNGSGSGYSNYAALTVAGMYYNRYHVLYCSFLLIQWHRLLSLKCPVISHHTIMER